MLEEALPQFQQFVMSRKSVPTKNVSFYAYWVSKFLAFSNNHANLFPKARVDKFLNSLRVSSSTQNQAFNALLFLLRDMSNVPKSPLDNFYIDEGPKNFPTF